MSARDLPYEIISMIVLELKLLLRAELKAKGHRWMEASLASYATICNSWKQVIERETFRSLSLNTERLDRAEKALERDPARRSAVRHILFLTPYYCSTSAKRDLSQRQLKQQDEAFSRDLMRLFQLLESMEKGSLRGHKAENLTLKLEVTLHLLPPEDEDGNVIKESKLLESTGYRNQAGGVSEILRFYTTLGLGSYETLEEMGHKHDSARLHYVGEALPTVHCIREFLFSRGGQSLVWESAFAAMFLAMHSLKHCTVAFDDKHTVKCSTRIRYRKALGETLKNIPTTCKTFHAYFGHEPDGVNAQLGFDYGSLDILSIELRELSMRLVKVSLESLVISPSLFWPDDSESAVTPYWPCLQHFEVIYAPSLAGGEWLVHENEEKREPLVERSQFTGLLRRQYLNNERTNDLLLAAAKAIRKMPLLRGMRLQMSSELKSMFVFHYRYKKDQKAFVARWYSYPNVFRVSTEVLQVLGIDRESLKDRHDLIVAGAHRRWKISHVPGLTDGGSIYEGICSPAPPS